MKQIVVAGGTGFLGEPLVTRLARHHHVLVISRDPDRVRVGEGIAWSDPSLTGRIAGADVVVNLAGENIGEGRWTEAKKRRILESRVGPTSKIVEAFRAKPEHQRALINVSAVGVYGSRASEVLTESSTAGDDFVAQVCRKWEEAAHAADDLARVVIPRMGVVLAADGGMLQRLLVPFRLFAGGRVGSGQQWLSWIARDDALDLFEWAIATESARGVYNGTSPDPVTNCTFTRALGRALHRPAIMPAPELALKAAFGTEKAEGLLLCSQRAIPQRTSAAGFRFAYESIDAALEHALEDRRAG